MTGNQHAHTYVAGEDNELLQSRARSMGLASARNPMSNVRAAVAALLQDSTLEAARMHSVGALGSDEHIDRSGTLHVRTLTRRKRQREDAKPPSYGALQNLFQPDEVETPAIYEDEEDTEVIEEDTIEGGSLTAAVFGIVKGAVGPAILYLPRGFSMAGYAVAIVLMIAATLCYLYSAARLLQCWRAEKAKYEKLEEIKALLEPQQTGSGVTPRATAETDGPVLLTYPELARRAFGSGAFFVQFGIAAMQFGVCLTYLIFVPQNLVECSRQLVGVAPPIGWFLVLMVIFEIPLSWIRDIRKLTPTNILATLLIVFGLASCLFLAVFGMDHESASNAAAINDGLFHRISSLPPVSDTWFLFVGTSFFVFEGSITLLVPLQEAVFRKEDKEKFPAVNVQVILGIIIFYTCFALVCWASFGDSLKTALTASLPAGLLSTVVQFAYSVAVILTFPLQAFPALEVVFHSKNISNTDENAMRRNAMASAITCGLGVVAYLAIDYLGNVVSLLGSLVGIPIALIFPPLMHNRLVVDSSKAAGTLWMNRLVATIGVLAMVASSFTTLISWDKGAE